MGHVPADLASVLVCRSPVLATVGYLATAAAYARISRWGGVASNGHGVTERLRWFTSVLPAVR